MVSTPSSPTPTPAPTTTASPTVSALCSARPTSRCPTGRTLDWALSQINLNNSFTASVIYDLPFGRGRQFGSNWNTSTNTILGNWQATLIERISSGFPDPLIYSNNQSGSFFQNGGNGNNWNRPDQVVGMPHPLHRNHSAHQFTNPSCFVAPPIGQLGNAARVPIIGPDFVNTDFSVIKQFRCPARWD